MSRALRILLACSLTSAACARSTHPREFRLHQEVPGTEAGLSLALFQSVGVDLRPGHAAELVEDGRFLEVVEKEVSQARESLHILAAAWWPGEASERLVRALASRPPGVACRILVEPLGSPGFQEEVAPRLTQAGCQVRTFRPSIGREVASNDERLRARNHRQLVIRDGRSGLTGGSGVGPAWRGDTDSPRAWRDIHLRVEGPAVRQMQQAFAADWQEAGGALLPAEAFPPLEPAGGSRAGFVATSGSPTLSHTERTMQLLIAAARHRLWLTNACFVPSTATVDMLILKAKAGVDVRILAPGSPREGEREVRAAQRATYARLLDNGVRLWEYQPALLRARTVLVDERLVAVGSMDLEPHSHESLEQGSLLVEDAGLARALAESFERDLAASLEIRRESWSRRGFLERMATRFPSNAGGCP